MEQASPQQGAPAPKKGGAWKWILISCLVILIVGGLAVGGCVWYGAKKVKEAGKDLEGVLSDLNFNYNYNYSFDANSAFDDFLGNDNENLNTATTNKNVNANRNVNASTTTTNSSLGY